MSPCHLPLRAVEPSPDGAPPVLPPANWPGAQGWTAQVPADPGTPERWHVSVGSRGASGAPPRMGNRQTEALDVDAHPNAKPKHTMRPDLKTLLLAPQPRTETLTSPRRRFSRRPPPRLE